MPFVRMLSNASRHRAITASFLTHRVVRQNEWSFNPQHHCERPLIFICRANGAQLLLVHTRYYGMRGSDLPMNSKGVYKAIVRNVATIDGRRSKADTRVLGVN